ncbi:MAG TPA: hypothetical protein ENG98_02500 [Actinobacteria bacterium]|nr:hypothetical protein [Actinomycetota bacterium]
MQSWLSDWWEAESTNVQSDIDALVGVCMRSQGFEYVEYVVEPPEGWDYGIALESFDYPLSSEEAAESGYGVFANFEERERAFELRLAIKNPNEAIYGALDQDARVEYDIAWLGFPRPPSDLVAPKGAEVDEMGVPLDWYEQWEVDESGGCRGAAEREIAEELDTVEIPPEWSETLAVGVASRVNSDPDFVDAERVWARCMNAAGYQATTITDLGGYISLLFQDVSGTARITQETVEVNGESIQIALPDYDDMVVADALDAERDLATTDVACRDESGVVETFLELKERFTREIVAELFSAN